MRDASLDHNRELVCEPGKGILSILYPLHQVNGGFALGPRPNQLQNHVILLVEELFVGVCLGVEHLGMLARQGRDPITIFIYPCQHVKGGYTRVQD